MFQPDGAVAYVVSTELVKISSLLPSNRNRSLLVHTLAKSLGLLSLNLANQRRLDLVKPQLASQKELSQYHDPEYLEFIFSNNITEESGGLLSEWGLEDDCPTFPGLSEYVRSIAGATLAAVQCLQQPKYEIAICWDGGRHHALKSRASGYCYVADCVLALMTLRRPTVPRILPSSPIHRPRVMYLDLDLHFSDGVSEAFYAPVRSGPPRTLSIHHTAPGFFPVSHLSGLLSDDDESFDPFTLSIPLREGASDCTYARIWPIVENVKDAFDPDYIVVQCGCDGLVGDPCMKFNWSMTGGEGSMGWCIERITNKWKGKKLLLGGGGYNSPNVARAWAYLTSIMVGRPLDSDTPIPDHEAFPLYAPSFTLDVAAGMMQDKNSEEYLHTIEGHYERVVPAIKDRLSASRRSSSCTRDLR
ncbi:histone deacetylase 8 [Amanita rubescens]|nr:histone deacetylase 8 [Amanita rubescens]